MMTNMDRSWRGGIIGCGYFGRIQLEAWARMPEAEIVAACDADLPLARQASPQAFDSAAEMFESADLDFVDIVTRPDSHLELVQLACAHRVPVLCQKPMAPDWASAVAMTLAAERAGVPLMIHENWRWQPWYRECGRRIQRGDIGRPVSYVFRMRKRDGLGEEPYQHQPYFREMPRLLLYETLVHHVDIARFLFGDIRSVSAQSRRVNPLIAGEDQAVAVLTHENGLMGVIDGNRFADPVPNGPAMGEALFEGEEGSLHVRATGDIYSGDECIWKSPPEVGYKGDSVLATQRHFLECLAAGQAFESGARDYLKTFGAVEAAYESIERGCVVTSNFWSL